MPLFDFECQGRGERFEGIASVGGRPACPPCGCRETRPLYSRIAGPQNWHIDRRFAAESNGRRTE